jgi:hypothetical protein
MGLILICVFGMTTQSVGVERALPIATGSHWYTVLTHESLPALKLQICESAYQEKADMAWEANGADNIPKDCIVRDGSDPSKMILEVQPLIEPTDNRTF